MTTTIPQRLREIARSVHEMEYGQPNALADSLHAIAAELEAPAADAVPVVAHLYEDPHDGSRYVYTYENSACPLYPEPLIRQRDHLATVAALQARINALEAKLNTPQLQDFASAVVLEAAHQRERWGAEHDAGKQPTDWFWLLGYLGGKALNAAVSGNHEKALHHTISTAAACANWHAALTGGHTAMRPGIDPVARGIEPQPDSSKEQP